MSYGAASNLTGQLIFILQTSAVMQYITGVSFNETAVIKSFLCLLFDISLHGFDFNPKSANHN